MYICTSSFPRRYDLRGNDNEFYAHEVMMWMAEGLGEAFAACDHYWSRKELKRKLLKRLAKHCNDTFVTVFYSFGDEPGEGGCSTRKWNFDELVNELVECHEKFDRFYTDPQIPDTLEKAKQLIDDRYSEWNRLLFFGTEKQHQKYAAEEKRRHIEPEAKALAAQYNVRLDSFEFLKALQKEQRKIDHRREDWNNPEYKMERYARCSMMGNTEGYYSDNDYTSGEFNSAEDTLRDIWEYLESECPLLMASYREKRLKRKAAKK
jgi:hypothetical protein